ncbi:MAG TPA: LPS export ABC transporter periplasmic protein LptC [Firmicutes bacterium]|nr:LPS export ABC transporter periplasmic protein LptC [Bacillota bacterium]
MRRLSRRKVIAALAVLICAGIMGIWWLSREPSPPSQEEAETRAEQGIYISDSRLVGRLEGKRQWEIASASVKDDGDNVELAQISQVIIFQDDAPYFTVDADRGRWHRPTNDLELMGDVSAVGPDDFSLATTRLIWQARTEVLQAPEPLVVHYQGAVIHADSMVAETKEELVTLTGNVRIVQDGLAWHMEELVYELDKELMHVYGSVTLQVEKGSGE